MGGFHHSCWCWNAQEGHEKPRNEGTSVRRPGRGSRWPFTQASSVLRPRKLPSVRGWTRDRVCGCVRGFAASTELILGFVLRSVRTGYAVR